MLVLKELENRLLRISLFLIFLIHEVKTLGTLILQVGHFQYN